MYYRIYDLPWTLLAKEEKAYWRILRNVCIGLAILIILLQVMPVPAPDLTQAPDIPPRLARVIVERQTPPPPPPPPPVVETVPEVTPPPTPQPRPIPQPVPQPVDRVAEARRQAASSGLLQLQDQLADLRDNSATSKATQTRNLTGTVEGTTSAERSLITSSVGRGSGGINTAAMSRGYGAGTGALTGHDTTQVSPGFVVGDGEGGPEVRRGSASGKAARSREEIELVFDRNKGAIYALYSRALRENPALQGKLVLSITIAPSGEVTACEVVSSDLKDADLERKLVARIKLFRFEAKDVETITTTKPIDFFPA